MKIRPALPAILGLLLLLGYHPQVSAQFSVSPVSSGSKNTETPGFFYALPRTVFKINIIVEENERIKGPYAEFAKRMLGIDDVIMQDETQYAIKDIIVSTLTEPDPKTWFFVEFDERSSRDTRTLIFEMLDNGIILAMDDAAVQRPLNSQHIETTMVNAPNQKHFRYFAEHNLFQRVDTIVRRITIDTTVIRRNILQTAWVDRNPEQKARASAEMIQKIRESRFNLISGFQEVNFSQIPYMDKQMLKLEEEYLSLFTGMEVRTLTEHVVYFTPEADARGFQTVARFTEQNGILESGNRGEPIQLVIEPAGNSRELGSANLRNRLNNALYYRIPETAEVSVIYKGKIYQRQRLPVSQLGSIAVAPASRTRLIFDPATGMATTIKRD
ncbi:MAG: DUF4831 family protein [Bacteroidetes bacterium]|nr:DUF4831 family protein [Bacteroidota bacterium]